MIKWSEKDAKVTDLRPYERNPRRISKAAYERLLDSLRTMGYHQRIIAQPDLSIIGGHQRIRALKELGMDTVKVLVPDRPLSVDEFRRILIQDNLPFGDFDFEMLASDFEPDELIDWGMPENWLDLGAKSEKEGLTDDDDVPDKPAQPITQLGDLWSLGGHRLLCGDSALVDDVKRLLNGQNADLIFTDPPWNVNYGDVERGNAQGYKPRKIMNDHMDDEKWGRFVASFVASFVFCAQPGTPIYVVMSAQEWPVLDRALRLAGFHWSSTIIWAKDSLVLSRKDYHTQYEPIWYGWRDGGARLMEVADRKQSDVWQINRPKKSDLHPTTKPVELIERAIQNSCRKNGTVVDLFGGSGSTLIAAEKTATRCCMMELDPAYCDVIIKRWEAFTGEKAQRIDNA